MIFNSMVYLVFFAILFAIYYIGKEKYRNFILLTASYIFYGYSNPKNLIILLAVTLISYFSGILVNKIENKHKKKAIIFVTITFIIGILLYFKYSLFILENINNIFKTAFSIENLIVPLGISFFTLQAITYPIDVYRRDIYVEKNILRFALFVSFFPQVLSGPIGKSKEILPQFKEKHVYDSKKVKSGFMIALHGLFKKVVIADLLAIGINNVYDNVTLFKGIPLLITVFMYSLQIYFDFSSYSNIAYGCGKMLGYELNKNFNVPYLADSIKNFWAKWHISLSTWFRDYLYIPLGGNRKGVIKTCLNLVIVFIVSGLWHGAAYTFIIWGLIHAVFQIIERLFKVNCKIKIVNIIRTFIIVTFAWIFFRANNLSDAIYVISNMFCISFVNIKEQILSIGLDKYDLIVASISIILVSTVEILNCKKSILEIFEKTPYILQIAICFIIVFSIIIFGSYGPGFNNSQFIYLGY